MLCKPQMTVIDELFEADVVGRTRFYRCAELVLSLTHCHLTVDCYAEVTDCGLKIYNIGAKVNHVHTDLLELLPAAQPDELSFVCV